MPINPAPHQFEMRGSIGCVCSYGRGLGGGFEGLGLRVWSLRATSSRRLLHVRRRLQYAVGEPHAQDSLCLFLTRWFFQQVRAAIRGAVHAGAPSSGSNRCSYREGR